MENNTIICQIEMFSKSQSVIFPDGKEARVALENITSYILS